MATITPDVYKVIQAYGGKKEAYFECDTVTAADVIEFSAENVSSIVFMSVIGDTDGAFVPCTVTGTSDTQLTVGAGPSAEKLVGKILFS